MSKKNTLSQYGDKRINPYLLVGWDDSNMGLSDDNKSDENDYLPNDEPFDANCIDNFDSYYGVQVVDRFGQVIGERMEYCKPKKKKK